MKRISSILVFAAAVTIVEPVSQASWYCLNVDDVNCSSVAGLGSTTELVAIHRPQPTTGTCWSIQVELTGTDDSDSDDNIDINIDTDNDNEDIGMTDLSPNNAIFTSKTSVSQASIPSESVTTRYSNASSGLVPGPVVNDYPAKYQTHCGEIDQWSLTSCQCVSFVAWRISSRLGVDFNRAFDGETWSNANTWARAAADAGIVVNSTPIPGAIAQTNAGRYGHVAWVAAVTGEEIHVEEYNALKPLAYDTRAVSASDFQYIHIPSDLG